MGFKKIDNNDLDFLVSICGEERVFTGENINEDYSHDELAGIHEFPEVLVRVKSTEEVSRIMKYA